MRTLMSRREFEITSQWIPVEIKRALAGMPGMSLVGEGGAGYFIMPMNTRLPADRRRQLAPRDRQGDRL